MRTLYTILAFTTFIYGCEHPDAISAEQLLATSSTNPSVYRRSDWGRWVDVDKDCQSTRQEVLIEESRTPVTLDSKGCRVRTGEWLDPYSGDIFTDPQRLDIDHVVPIKEAHTSGGYGWGPEKKRAYFNNLQDPQHLVAVSLSANRSKGSRTPVDWMPSNKAHRCDYLKAWVRIKHRWGLELTYQESQGLLDRFITSCDVPDDFEIPEVLPKLSEEP